jgi:hypothetical protein
MTTRFLIAAILLISTACNKKDDTKKADESANSFLPLQIGNYWKVDSQNYTEIQDTVRIKGILYYKLFSLTGGDVASEEYYRIDENQNLILGSVRYPDHQYLKAKFNASVGETFQTLGDKSYNDYKVTVIEKTDNKITFSYDMIYHPNLKGHPHTISFVKGLGWANSWKAVRINGKILRY